MNSVAKLSMVAMRVCVRCMKSNASSAAPHHATRLSRNIRRSRSHINGSMATPKSVPMKRQPNGVMPKSTMPSERISLPSGGCETSYGYTPRRCS